MENSNDRDTRYGYYVLRAKANIIYKNVNKWICDVICWDKTGYKY